MSREKTRACCVLYLAALAIPINSSAAPCLSGWSSVDELEIQLFQAMETKCFLIVSGFEHGKWAEGARHTVALRQAEANLIKRLLCGIRQEVKRL